VLDGELLVDLEAELELDAELDVDLDVALADVLVGASVVDALLVEAVEILPVPPDT